MGGFLRRSKVEMEKEGKRSEKEEQGKTEAQQKTVQEPGGWSPPAQLDNSVKTVKEAPEAAPGAVGSLALPPAWGLVLVAVFPPQAT